MSLDMEYHETSSQVLTLVFTFTLKGENIAQKNREESSLI